MNFFKFIYIYIFVILFAHSKGLIFDYKGDFVKAVNLPGFVDKTMLIETVFQSPPVMLITAPRKFGKSMNLDMLKNFLSVESKHNSDIISIFKKTKIYEKNNTFFRQNFAEHPVLFVDFKCGKTSTYQDAVDCYRRAIHNSYEEHSYLISSHKLRDDEKEICKLWFGETSYREMEKKHIKGGLGSLARILQKHFNKNIVVLIDEYDSVINNALFELNSNSEFRAIIALTTDILTKILKGNKNVNVAILTGVSYISTTGLSDINNLVRFRFLDDHPFARFYGLTEEEVDELLQKDEFKPQLGRRDVAKSLYNGYICKRGRNIYNTYSFLRFLESGKAISYLHNHGYASGIFGMLKYPETANIVKLLLDDKSINIEAWDDISIEDVFALKDMYSKSINTSYQNRDLLLSHLLEIGFLTYNQMTKHSNHDYYDKLVETTQVKIPNKEVYTVIFRKFKYHYIEKCNLPDSLRPASYPTFMQHLYKCWKSVKNPCAKVLGVFFTAAAEEGGKSVVKAFGKSKLLHTTKNNSKLLHPE